MANSMQNKIGNILHEKCGVTVDWSTYVCNSNNKSWRSADMPNGIVKATKSNGDRCQILFYCKLKEILKSEIEIAGWNSFHRISCSLDACDEIMIDVK